MKIKIYLIAVQLFAASFLFSQQSTKINFEQYKLKNGLTVFLNEDHTASKVMGAVIVKGGGKRDPKDATGIAHYFEHIMFKGTDNLGTIDYKSEKVFLDSIELNYEILGKTQDEKERAKIQLRINELSIKAAQFAIPNEFDKVVNGMGGANVNAFTSNDNIVYFNEFPGNQMNKWIELYSDRFVNPVFRLFQSELETVYEEKNMSMDQFFNQMFESYMKNFYKKHPNGQQTILGSVDHLKNPSLKKMREYYNTYYVANNMALVFTGDFDAKALKPLIEEKFGKWRSADVPAMPDYKEEPFKGREQVNVRLTPVRIGMLGYRCVPQGHPDQNVIDVISNLLSNGSTGYFDKLTSDNKLLAAQFMNLSHPDIGGLGVLFVPKIVGQKMGNAEKLVIEQIERIKNGDFTDEMLNATKLQLKMSFYENIENSTWRAYTIIDVFNQNKTWDEAMKYPEEIEKVTKQDIIDVAKKYFGNDYLAFYSKTGIPKKTKLKKPPYKPILPPNSEAKSEFAKKIEAMPEVFNEKRFIEFNPATAPNGKVDVSVGDISNNIHYFYTENPINQIFTLNLKYGVGTAKLFLLDNANAYIGFIGTNDMSYDDFQMKLSALGGSMYTNADKNYFNVEIKGLDENFNAIVDLVSNYLKNMKADDKQLEKLTQWAKAERKMETKEPFSISSALKDYSMYKNESAFLKRLSISQIKALKSDSLISVVKKALQYEAEYAYVGTKKMEDVIAKLKSDLVLTNNPIKSESPQYFKRADYTENTIYFVDNSKAVQSQIAIWTNSNQTSKQSKLMAEPFNKYFGEDMNSLVFQEIREFRSFAYMAYAYYSPAFKIGDLGSLNGMMSTQSDKTIDALKVFMGLFKDMPQKPERLDLIKKAIDQSVNTNRGSFRDYYYSVSYWKKQGYNDDPKKEYLKYYKNMSFNDITDFYKNNFENKPLVICIVGEKKRVNMDELNKMGKVIELKTSDIFRK
ncbi:MAG: insulinase family protein [Bacteroidota bacterium]